MNIPEELSVPQVADYLKVSQETVRRNIRSRRLRAVRRGTQWFVSLPDIVEFASSYDPKTGRVTQGSD